MYIKCLELSEEERVELARNVKKGGTGARLIGRKHWLAEGFAWLADKHRCDEPAKLMELQHEQSAYGRAQALTTRQLEKAEGRIRCGAASYTLDIIFKKMHFV